MLIKSHIVNARVSMWIEQSSPTTKPVVSKKAQIQTLVNNMQKVVNETRDGFFGPSDAKCVLRRAANMLQRELNDYTSNDSLIRVVYSLRSCVCGNTEADEVMSKFTNAAMDILIS